MYIMDSQAQELSVEEIARRIFAMESPAGHGYELIPDEYDLGLSFEILITFFMEGVAMRFGDGEAINLGDVDGETVTRELQRMAPWVEAMGFQLSVEQFRCSTEIERHHYFGTRYCKILVRTPDEARYFEQRGLDKLYTFMLNPSFRQGRVLSDYYAIFALKEDVYRISFRCLPQ
jgi:hypothetical protein